MKVLIQLSMTYSEAVWVNPDYIASISRHGTGSDVFIANDPSPVVVVESPEEIISRIQSAYGDAAN